MSAESRLPHSYREAGVDLEVADRAKRAMARAVRSTFTPDVLSDMGSFGGLFDLTRTLARVVDPVLVASTDGVGTKTVVAARVGRFGGLGHDLVNHCVNDILVQGAEPLFFLDYVATARLDAETAAAIVEGVAEACRAVDCVLLGGETAEMPSVYHEGSYDLAGTIVGVVGRGSLIDGTEIHEGDVLLALPASGLHTNGYSLARRVVADRDLLEPRPELGESLAEALLRPHRSYLGPIRRLRTTVAVRGLAHITGGGFEGNLSRILPPGLAAVVQTGQWQPPALFRLLQEWGEVPGAEMYRTFNMGVGMVMVVRAAEASATRQILPESFAIGEIVRREEGSGLPSVQLELS